MSGTHHFNQSTWIAKPIEEVFDFFSRAENLQRITPPHLDFRILTPQPIVMREGALIDYRLKLYRFPIRWKTEITAWEPPRRFVDTQLKGPYRIWVHEHLFTPERGGTRMEDRVSYAVPGGFLEPAIHRLLVRPDVEEIFRFRSMVLGSVLGTRVEIDETRAS